MTNETKTANAAEETGTDKSPDVAVETSSKDEIYTFLGEAIKDMTGKRVGKAGGRKLFDMVVEQTFAHATKNGTFRFNAGFGSMHTRTYGAGTRRLPSGQETTFGERQKLRYEEGVVVAALVANGGNLEEAIKARGSRTADAHEADATSTATSKETADANLD